MFFVVLIAILTVVAGYFVHKNFATCPSPASFLAIGISQRSAKAKKSTKSAYETAIFDTLTTDPVSNKSKKSVKKNKPFSPAAESTQEEPKKKDVPSDRSSRDVKTAIFPLPEEENKPSVDVKTALDISLRESTALNPTPSETLRGQLGNLPDSTARNVSSSPSAANNTEVQADPATAKALGPESEKKLKEFKSKDGKKKKSSGRKTRSRE